MTKNEIQNLSNADLISKLKSNVAEEKYIVIQILKLLDEVQRRRLYFEYGYTSLFQFTMKELNYTEAQAQLRISTMRLAQEIPEIREKVANGSLSLSAVSKAQSFFREKGKINEPLQTL